MYLFYDLTEKKAEKLPRFSKNFVLSCTHKITVIFKYSFMENNILQLMKKIQLLSVKINDSQRDRFMIMNLNNYLFVGSFLGIYLSIVELFFNEVYPLNMLRPFFQQ